MQADLARSATTTGEPSWSTRNVLYENGLFDLFAERPGDALAEMHKLMMATQGDPDVLFALAELSYIHGADDRPARVQPGVRGLRLGVSVPRRHRRGAGPIRPPTADRGGPVQLVSRGGLRVGGGLEVVPRGGTIELPFGKMEVAFDPASLRAGDRELYKFIPIAELEVFGLAMRYRWPGIGAPLAASTRPVDASKPGRDLVAPRMQVPLTALLRIPQARRTLAQGQPLAGKLELHLAWDERNGHDRRREGPARERADGRAGAHVHRRAGHGDRDARISRPADRRGKERPPLVSTTPYRPGLIPVVFVHGTASSIVRWAEMFNRLEADPDLRSHYQFWFFQYDSGNPIAPPPCSCASRSTPRWPSSTPRARTPPCAGWC